MKKELEIQVKEATKSGFAVARGGGMLSISPPLEARREEEGLVLIWQTH